VTLNQQNRAQWQVVCEGHVVSAWPFDDREDAEGWAGAWNSAYPPEQGYPEFVVEQVAS
jgi:hypothetical protein